MTTSSKEKERIRKCQDIGIPKLFWGANLSDFEKEQINPIPNELRFGRMLRSLLEHSEHRSTFDLGCGYNQYVGV